MTIHVDSRPQGSANPAFGIGTDGLSEFCNNLFYSFARSDQRRWGELYVRGLMTVPGRKTVKKISELAGGGAEQCLQQFVNQSTWDWTAVRRELAARLTSEMEPHAWVAKEIVFPKNGVRSVGVARQFAHSTGRVQNCQRAIAIFLTSDQGSCPVNWRLILPQAWDKDHGLRETARLPEDERCRPAWRYVLDAIDEMVTDWGLPPAPVVMDISLERHVGVLVNGLEALSLDYLLQVADSRPAMIVNSPQHGQRTISFADVINEALKGNMPASSMWQLPAVRPGKSPFIVTGLPGEGPGVAASRPRRPPSAVPGQYRPKGSPRPQRYVAAEWSPARRAAKSTWLTTLEALAKPSVVDLTALNDQVNADLADLYANTGLRHFEGRSFPGWHHYTTLVSVACGWSHLYGAPSEADLAFG